MQRKFGKALFAVAIAIMLIALGTLSYLYMSGGQLPYSGTPNDNIVDPGDYDPDTALDLAPDFNYRTVNGDYVSLSGLRGNVVIIDFMAMWCQPCGIQMPVLSQIYSEYSGRGVTIISLDVDTSESAADLLAYRTQAGAMWHFAFDENGIGSNPDYDARSIPTLVIIKKDGTIANRYVGVTDVDTLKSAINPLI